MPCFARLDAAPDTTTWADIFALQTAYFMALPDYRLGDEVKLMRARFQKRGGRRRVQSVRSDGAERYR